MDLSKLQAIRDAESADFIVRDPATDAPVIILTLAGPTHPARVALTKKYEGQLGTALARASDPRKALQRSFLEVADPEVRAERDMELLMVATLGWKSADGSPADQPYDATTMESLYREKAWLRKQVREKLADDEGFTQRSPTSS